MSEIIFNIYGGNNQILPNATEANQYYGDNGHKGDDDPTGTERLIPSLSPEAQHLSLIYK